MLRNVALPGLLASEKNKIILKIGESCSSAIVFSFIPLTINSHSKLARSKQLAPG